MSEEKKEQMWGARLDRLSQLLAHMERGKLSVDRFHFGAFRATTECGTMGCMAGELPTVFPGEWEEGVDTPHLKEIGPEWRGHFVGDACWFFGLRFEEARRLFYPGQDRAQLEKGRLPAWASREQVADNLRQFIEERTRRRKIVKGLFA